MSIARIATINDFVAPARARLPRFAFHSLAGGAGDDAGVLANEAAFKRHRFMPRRFQSLATDQSVSLFGRQYAQPFGVAPMGLANLFHSQADLALAAAAQVANIPFVLSTSASTAIERIVEVAPDVSWYQLYLLRDTKLNSDMLRRVRDCGVSVLVLTVDVPLGGRRNSAIRDDIALPLRWSPRFLSDVVRHPRWAFDMLLNGGPKLENYAPHAGTDDLDAASRHIASVMKMGLRWHDLEAVRAAWPGKLVVKGIMHPDDAMRCLSLGADAIWISNHGGRQLESAVAPLDVLPAIRTMVGPRAPLLFDGGVRTGEDVLKAAALGADFCFSGRAFAFPVSAYGAAGAQAAINILSEEIRSSLAQLGVERLSALGPAMLRAG